MKKFTLSLGGLLLAVATILTTPILTACSSDESGTEEQPQPSGTHTYTLTVNATKGELTRALTQDGNTIAATWGENEKVYV